MHLGQFQQRLNTDPQFRQEFLNDPAALLRREGLHLSSEQERVLRDATARFKTSAPSLPGATVGRVSKAIPVLFIYPPY
jgi:hypothetical protein